MRIDRLQLCESQNKRVYIHQLLWVWVIWGSYFFSDIDHIILPKFVCLLFLFIAIWQFYWQFFLSITQASSKHTFSSQEKNSCRSTFSKNSVFFFRRWNLKLRKLFIHHWRRNGTQGEEKPVVYGYFVLLCVSFQTNVNFSGCKNMLI